MPRTAPQDHLQGGGMVPSCSRGGHDPPTISGPEDTSVRMLRTVSPSPAGAGVRCLYQGGSLLEGWQERAWSLPFHTATGSGNWHFLTLTYPKHQAQAEQGP